MKIVSVIPARGGSKGIPKKNIINLAGQPLIGYSILDSLRTKEIEETFVTSEDADILNIAGLFGAVKIKRPFDLSGDNALDIDWALHFIRWYKKLYIDLPDYIVLLRTTTPIRDTTLISRAIQKLKENPEATSLRSVEEFPESPYKWFDLKEDYLLPLLSSFEDTDKPRQQVAKAYKPNGYVDILKTKTLLRKSLYGDKILSFITPPTVEIDTVQDFIYANYLLSKSE